MATISVRFWLTWRRSCLSTRVNQQCWLGADGIESAWAISHPLYPLLPMCFLVQSYFFVCTKSGPAWQPNWILVMHPLWCWVSVGSFGSLRWWCRFGPPHHDHCGWCHLLATCSEMQQELDQEQFPRLLPWHWQPWQVPRISGSRNAGGSCGRPQGVPFRVSMDLFYTTLLRGGDGNVASAADPCNSRTKSNWKLLSTSCLVMLNESRGRIQMNDPLCFEKR